MKKVSLILVGFVLATSVAHTAETVCGDADCVTKKNSTMAAVFNFLFNEDSCVNDTQWLSSVVRVTDMNFTAVCTDGKKSVNLKLKVTDQKQNSGVDGDYFVEIVP
ncbi:hypothetical protein [Bdellovibrio sp. NC01]|uniref:hypothetical protein n=1 Tax=Bdellovibrio sp. NC01 TaxID=2220073 RepID=UPI001157FB2C|nr:hypothetical protein [Bdellovibrio sp. NC01]QDK37721.1 hypothetical protein DOE51_09055 [Bdellovibrio sp. NC01]